MSTAAEFLARHLSQLEEGNDLYRIYPLLQLAGVSEENWQEAIPGTPFAVAWAFVGEMNFFEHISRDGARMLDEASIKWRSQSYRNLEALARVEPANGYKDDERGHPFIQIMLHKDGMGPSRLLVPGIFVDIFGTDYEVAIPEQTCAVAYRTGLSGDMAFVVEGMVQGCFSQGTTPMSPERFRPEVFWEPSKKWLREESA